MGQVAQLQVLVQGRPIRHSIGCFHPHHGDNDTSSPAECTAQNIDINLLSYLPYLASYLPSYLHACIHTCKWKHACIATHLATYLSTCMHTCM